MQSCRTSADLDHNSVVATALPRCRWFARDWTLQGLLAPEHICLYDRNWNWIRCPKSTLAGHISSIARISIDALLNIQLDLATVATEMPPAARREAKRVEDMTYAMLKIFDVNMGLIYGKA
jgi:hypothetical protein